MTRPTGRRVFARSPGYGAVLAWAATVVGIDQVSKHVAAATLTEPWRPGPVKLELVRNRGAGFGIGSAHPIAVTLLAAVTTGLVTLLVRSQRDPAARWMVGLVLGGAVSNLLDRLHGTGAPAVLDWIHLAGYPATFNVADVAIRAGVLAWVVQRSLAHRGAAPRARGASRTASPASRPGSRTVTRAAVTVTVVDGVAGRGVDPGR